MDRYYDSTSIIEALKKRGSSPGLREIQNLLAKLGHPERESRILHVAGTNGKGSVVAYLHAMLRERGFKTGQFLSPTISGYEERFQINGNFIPPDTLRRYLLRLRPLLFAEGEERGPTLFEAETALAFLYFAGEQVDYGLLETGMGGRLDATNAVEQPELTIITSVSFDHKAFLGDTLTAIAGEKAGIIKEGVPVIAGENEPEVCKVIEEVAAEKQAPLFRVHPEDYTVREETPRGSTFLWRGTQFETRLPGRHQVSNAVTALTAMEVLLRRDSRENPAGKTAWAEELRHMQRGILSARRPGRLELLRERPCVYRDGAHNPDGALMLARFLEKHFTNKKILYIMGVLKDKEYEIMLARLLPLAAKIFTFTPKNERGLPGETLAEAARTISAGQGRPVDCEAAADVNEALRRALAMAGREDVLVVCGSLSFMEEMEETIWT